jgi:hypothetical protein
MGNFGFSPDGRFYAVHPQGGFLVTGPPDWPLVQVGLPGVAVAAMSVSAKQSGLLYCLGTQNVGPSQTHIFFRFDVARGVAESVTPIPSSIWPDPSGVQIEVTSAEDVAYCAWNLFLGDRGAGNLWVLDLRTLKFVSNTFLDYGINDFCIDEPARKIYVAGSWSGGSAPGTMPLVE